MKIKRIALVGGSGFVGRHLTRHLHNLGYECRIITRHAHRHRELSTVAELIETDPFETEHLKTALRDCNAAINLVGILNANDAERSFRHVHVELVESVVSACLAAKVGRLLHMSALNADEARGGSQYLRSKGEGENRAHTLGKAAIAVTSFRPSVIFGVDDSFLNRFAALLKIPGPLPLACPDAKLAPVYVGDVAAAFANALQDPGTFGRHYELCGPHSYTLEQLVRFVSRNTGQHKRIIRLSDKASRMQASILQHFPGKPFTPDNYLSLRTPSVCGEDGLRALGVTPTSLENAGARCLARVDKNRQLSRLRRLSQR
jgi:uncharacterized protein YbjT (DUF2867 family)